MNRIFPNIKAFLQFKAGTKFLTELFWKWRRLFKKLMSPSRGGRRDKKLIVSDERTGPKKVIVS